MPPQAPNERRPDETSAELWWQHHGFTENPFSLREAGQERRLSEYFVHGQDYDAVRGISGVHQTAIVFAARGRGKSAYRRMIQTSCRPDDDESPILAVAHTEFSSVLSASSSLASITLESHVEALLRSAAATLLREFMRRPASFDYLPLEDRNLFSWLIHTYAPRALRPLDLVEELMAIGAAPKLESQAVRKITRSRERFEEWLRQPPMDGNPQARLLLALLRTQPAPPAEGTIRDPVALVREFVDLARQSGLQAVYFLVDGLDELRATATDPAAVADLVIPLLAEVPLMELNHSAFKFFLPAETVVALNARCDSRLDRFPVYHLAWRDADLRHMLRLRLMAFNERGVDSLGAISDEDIAGRIDADLVEMAYGSPRRLLMLGDALFAAHAARLGDGLLLNQQDWDDACRNLRVLGPLVPPLRVDREMGKLFIGDDEFPSRLSPMEFGLLDFLYRAGGRRCSRDEISFALRERPEYGVISDEAFDSLVSRLRRKIERHPKRPVYLITERGMGYRLENIG